MLTYIEPCGWCSSSISSTYCPSNVGKPFEPCPNLSSSHSSTSSLISNNDSTLSPSMHSFSSDHRTKSTSTCLIRGSQHHPEDYYTNKRIEQLHERMDDIQISNFLLFINHHLALKKDTSKRLDVNDFIGDLSNGHILIDLIELFSSTKLKREHGRTRFHSLSNIQSVLDYLKLHIQHVNISPHNIVSGNRKQILALLWMIMKFFHFPDFHLKKKNCFVENTLLGFGQDRSVILKWLNGILHHCSSPQSPVLITEFSLPTWSNGYYLSLILKYLIPLSLKYFTMQCFDYLKELNSSSKQRLQVCFQLSSYCFDTRTNIDYTDRTNTCLFKYFTELYGNILIILNNNQLAKCIQINPYTKEILRTVIQSTEHSSDVSYDNEQYLVCTGEKHSMKDNSMDQSRSSVDDLSRIRTVEKSRLFNDKQQKIISTKINRWEKAENILSHSPLINGHDDISKEIIEKSPELNGAADSTETNQPLAFTDLCSNTVSTATDVEKERISSIDINNTLDEIREQTIVEQQQQVQASIESNKDEQIIHVNENIKLEEIQEPISESSEQNEVLEKNSDQSVPERLQEENLKQTVTSGQEIEQPIIVIDEQQSPTFDENIETLEETVSTTPVDTSVDDVNEIGENKAISIEHEQITSFPENRLSMNADDRSEQVLNGVTMEEKLVPCTVEFEQTEEFSDEPQHSNQVLTSIENVEQSSSSSITIEENPMLINEKKSEEFADKESSPNTMSEEETATMTLSTITVKQMEEPAAIEPQGRVTSNEHSDKITTNYKKSKIQTKIPISTASPQPTNSHSPVVNEQRTSSSVTVESSEPPHPIAATPATIPKPIKYSEIVRKPTPKTSNKPKQQAISTQRAEPSTVSISSSKMSSEKFKPSHVTAERIEQVPLTSTIKESVHTQVSLDQFTTNLKEQPSASMESNEEETKKSPGKNKKSRRSNTKKNKAKTPSPPPPPTSQLPKVIIEEPPLEIAQPAVSSTHSSALRTRKSKKKKTIATTSTTLIENPSSSFAISTSNTSYRNLFLVIRESLGDRKLLAFKFVFILICLCCSILILVLSHK